MLMHNKKVNTFRYADQVTNGDELLVQRNYDLAPAKVINVFNLIVKGRHSYPYFSLKYLEQLKKFFRKNITKRWNKKSEISMLSICRCFCPSNKTRQHYG